MESLDAIFPGLVFIYGSLLVIITHSRRLESVAQKKMNPVLVEWFYGHRLLGKICFFVGFFWTLQRLYIA